VRVTGSDRERERERERESVFGLVVGFDIWRDGSVGGHVPSGSSE